MLAAMAKHIFESCHSAWNGTFVFLCLGLGPIVPVGFDDSLDLNDLFCSWTQLYYLLQLHEVFLEESKKLEIDPPLIFCMDQTFTTRCCHLLQSWQIFGVAKNFKWDSRPHSDNLLQDVLSSLLDKEDEGKVRVSWFSSSGCRRQVMAVQHWFKRNFPFGMPRVVFYGPHVPVEAWDEVSKMIVAFEAHEKHDSSAASSAVQSIRFIVSEDQKNTHLPSRLPAHVHLSEL
jgi:hypothetical protein